MGVAWHQFFNEETLQTKFHVIIRRMSPPKRPRSRNQKHLRIIPPPDATPEEREQGRLLQDECPWALPVRQFIKRVEADYGFRLKSFPAIDPDGNKVRMYYLQNQDKKIVHLPGIDFDEQLDEFTTGSLCRRIGIPPEEFGLPPEEPVEDVEEFDLGD